MKKVMLLAAVVAMVLAAAVPALAQTVTQIGDGNIACVQTAVQQNVVSQGNGNAQANQYGDNIIANSNINAQAIAQECNITVAQVNTVVNEAPHLQQGWRGRGREEARCYRYALQPALPPAPLLMCSTRPLLSATCQLLMCSTRLLTVPVQGCCRAVSVRQRQRC